MDHDFPVLEECSRRAAQPRALALRKTERGRVRLPGPVEPRSKAAGQREWWECLPVNLTGPTCPKTSQARASQAAALRAAHRFVPVPRRAAATLRSYRYAHAQQQRLTSATRVRVRVRTRVQLRATHRATSCGLAKCTGQPRSLRRD